MRILYIVPFVPWPLRVRSFNLIPRLSRDHEIFLVCLTGSAEEESRSEALRPFCKEIRLGRHSKARAFWQCARGLMTPVPLRMAYFASAEMQEAVRQAVRQFSPDVIYTERWRSLQYVSPGIAVPVVCDPTDSMLLYNERLMRSGRWWERVVGWEEALKFRRYEGTLARRADAVVFCSRADLACVERAAPGARCALVPNGVDCETFFMKQAPEEEPDTIVFTGNFGYGPNCQAARFFLGRVLPLIRREIPRARFLAVGNGATRFLGRRARCVSGIEVLNFVPELRPYIARASVAIAPIRTGAGVSNKLGEAFATGTAVVATRVACGDMAVRDGEHLLLADDAPAFAARVIQLLQNPELRDRLTTRARKLAEEQYDWEIVSRLMERVLLDAAKGGVAAEEKCLAAAV